MYFTYPAIFEPDPDGNGFTVIFPDLPGCITEGESIEEALKNAEEAMSLYLEPEDESPVFPKATEIRALSVTAPAFATLVRADVEMGKQRAVRKNLTIPAWLNARAEAQGVNFSQVLQEALKDKLG